MRKVVWVSFIVRGLFLGSEPGKAFLHLDVTDCFPTGWETEAPHIDSLFQMPPWSSQSLLSYSLFWVYGPQCVATFDLESMHQRFREQTAWSKDSH